MIAAATSRSHVGSNIIALPFALGQRVRVDAIDVIGLIKRITVSAATEEYMVRYFDDDKVSREEWMEASEISKL